MADNIRDDQLRRELIAQSQHGPETYIGQLAGRAAEHIRRLENEVEDLRSYVRSVRAAVNGRRQ